jgi:NADH:ubiquinone oxidoreductase subunit 5 (subunit L)/multisubunit Na+/H+ antiporter MnhA subunit
MFWASSRPSSGAQQQQLDATISQVYYLTFMDSSTCFGRPHAPHQEPNNCHSSRWFYRWSLVIAVLLVVVGPAGYHHAPTVKPETATQLLSSWWWAWGRPKHVESYINVK